jgi:hypothetical protein
MQSARCCIVAPGPGSWRKRIFTQGTPDKDAATGSLPNELLCGGNRLVREASWPSLSAISLSKKENGGFSCLRSG